MLAMKYGHLISVVEASDDDVKKYKRDTYGALLRISCLEIFSYVRDPSFLVQLTAQLVIWAMFCTFGFYSCWFLLSNLIYFLKLLQVLCLQLLDFFICFRTNFYPERMERLYRFMASSDFMNYGSVMIPVKKQLKNAAQKELRSRIYPLLITSAITGIIPFITVFVEPLLSSESTSPYYDGINIALPVPLYSPFLSHEGWRYYACLLFEITAVMSGFAAGKTIAFVVLLSMQRILFEMKILTRSVELIHERAEALAKDNPAIDFEECLLVCLQQNIIHYKMIKQACADFHSACSIIVALAMGFVSVMTVLGLTVLNNLYVEGEIVKGVIPLCFICGTMSIAFVVNLFGESITTENDNLFNALYFLTWCEYPKKFKKTFLIFKEFVKRPLKIYFGIWPFCLDTYAEMLRGAFSYFNMLNAISDSQRQTNSVENVI